jgi:hypothetical protein
MLADKPVSEAHRAILKVNILQEEVRPKFGWQLDRINIDSSWQLALALFFRPVVKEAAQERMSDLGHREAVPIVDR